MEFSACIRIGRQPYQKWNIDAIIHPSPLIAKHFRHPFFLSFYKTKFPIQSTFFVSKNVRNQNKHILFSLKVKTSAPSKKTPTECHTAKVISSIEVFNSEIWIFTIANPPPASTWFYWQPFTAIHTTLRSIAMQNFRSIPDRQSSAGACAGVFDHLSFLHQIAGYPPATWHAEFSRHVHSFAS